MARRVYAWLILLFLVAGCSKSRFTLPSSVRVEMTAASGSAVGGRLQLDSLVLRPYKITFRGSRPSAPYVELVRTLDGAIWTLPGSFTVTLDLPQGVYDNLSMQLAFLGDAAFEDEISEAIEEWWEEIQQGRNGEDELATVVEEYLDYAAPSCMLSGWYNSASRGKVKFYMVIPAAYNLDLQASKNGANTISILSEATNSSQVVFQPAQWATQLSVAALENAYYADGDDEDILFVHPRINATLYTLILSGISSAQSWTFY